MPGNVWIATVKYTQPKGVNTETVWNATLNSLSEPGKKMNSETTGQEEN